MSDQLYETFSRSLYKIDTSEKQPQSLEGYLGGSTLIGSDGTFDFANIKLGVNNIFVPVGGSIQQAIDSLNERGGGKVFLAAGIHTINAALTGYTGVDLIGENQSTTIIDFNSTAANLSFTGTSVYSTGTITSITSGINVTGSGTSWLANVTTDHQIFIGNTWYKIGAVLTDTTLTLSEGYQGNATLPGAAYRASKIILDVDVQDITFKNSTGTALVATDCRNFRPENLKFVSNNKGFVFTNISEFLSDRGLTVVSSTSNGGEITNARICNFHALSLASNGGHGIALNNYTTGVISESSAASNTTDGFNLTSCTDLVMGPIESSANGGQGMELVSGNDNIIIGGGSIFNANTSDAIKLTATSDNCKIYASKIANNGGYGVNVAASSCDNNLISTSIFSNNSPGDKNDSGTGTLWTANIPDSINTGGSPSSSSFGGDGSDGALSSSSGTTTLNLGGAQVFVKNYSSISLTGTADVQFSNPHASGTTVILKSSGAVTITSSTNPATDLRSVGGTKGTGGAIGGANPGSGGGGGASASTDGSVGNSAAGGANPGTVGTAYGPWLTGNEQTGGGGGSGATGGAGGLNGGISSNSTKYLRIGVMPGSGGGGGGGGNTGAGGDGGRGGGALWIECAGALNISSTLNAAGANGSKGSGNGGGGGGGGAGSIVILYGTLTANTGTYTVTGGTAGTGSGANGGDGAAGFSSVTANTEFA